MKPARGKRLAGTLARVLVFLCLMSGTARAATSFDTLSFKPSNDASYYLTLYGSRTLTTWNWTTGFYLDYSRDSLILVQSGAQAGSIVNDLLGGHFFGGIGLLEWMDVGLTAAVALVDDFIHPVTRTGETVTRFGDLRFHMKFRLLDQDRYPIGLSVVPYVDIPTGSEEFFVGNGSFGGGGHIVVDTKRFQNRFSFAANLGYFARDNVTLTGGTEIDDAFTYGIGGNIMLVPAVDFIAELHGSTVVSNFFANSEESPLEALGGFRFYFGQDRRFRVTVAGGGGLVSGVGSPRFRAVAGLAYTPPFAYREVELGEPTVREAYEVYELVDKCPIEVEGYVVGRDDPRCTEVYELKSIAEACPEEGTFNPEVDNPRCLQVYLLREKDSDRDGVPDFQDRCPTEPGERAQQGCPTMARVVIRLDEGAILTQVIPFDFNEATLRDDAFPILDSLAATIRSQPALERISIDGHTDKIGGRAYNLELSRKRAKAVYDYLVKAGVNPQRLKHRGFGSDVPVADNRLEDGRAKNRRVEFLIQRVSPGLGEALEVILGGPQPAVAPVPSQPVPEAPAETRPEPMPTEPPGVPMPMPAAETAPALPPETVPEMIPETAPAALESKPAAETEPALEPVPEPSESAEEPAVPAETSETLPEKPRKKGWVNPPRKKRR